MSMSMSYDAIYIIYAMHALYLLSIREICGTSIYKGYSDIEAIMLSPNARMSIWRSASVHSPV